jgi:small GTP-binding protein
MSVEPKRAYKIVLIGDPEVGKTSIRRKYMGKSFRADYLKTLGADFAATKVNIDGDTVLLTIWDLAGQSIFHGMRSSFYHGCKCALVVVDVTNQPSLDHSFKWAEEATNFAKNSLQEIYLIGNKIDLVNERVIQNNQIEEVAQKFRDEFNFPVKVYETSALTGENINELFEHMSRKLIYGDANEEEETPVSEPQAEVESQPKPEIKSEESKTNSIDQLHTILADLEDRIDQMQESLSSVKKKMKELE